MRCGWESHLDRCFPPALILVSCATMSWAQLDNGDFSDGLNSWHTQGDVSVVDDAAALGDDGAFYSYLLQPVLWLSPRLP